MSDPLVISAELYSDWEGEGILRFAAVKVKLPLPFDFQKDGPKLLRDIESAANLFSEERNETDK